MNEHCLDTLAGDNTPTKMTTLTEPELPAFLLKHLKSVADDHGFVEYRILCEAGSKNGDGFMSEMLAVTLDGYRESTTTTTTTDGQQRDTHKLHLICKRQPSDQTRREQFNSSCAFEREVLMYNRVLPILNQMQLDRGLDESNGFFAYPRCYFACYDPDNEAESLLIMENLRTSGFSMCDKTAVTPFENVRILFEQLGRLHGLSFVLRDQKPELLREMASWLPELMGKIILSGGFVPIFQSGYARAAEICGDGPYGDLLKKIQCNWKAMYEMAFDIKRYEKFAVLTHGDCWINNMMFTYNANGIADRMTLFDWQASHMRSPAADLAHFIFTVTDVESRAQHLDTYLNVYYSNAAATIRHFGCDPEQLYSRADFDQQMKENGFAAVLLAPLMLPVLICKGDDLLDMSAVAKTVQEEGASNEAAHMAVLDERTEVIFRERLNDIFTDADRYGWLDTIKETSTSK